MDELLSRKVPYSSEAEQAILGSILIDPACIPDVVNNVNTSDFYIDANRYIFETIHYMFSVGIRVDAVTVLDQMKARKVRRDNTHQYFVELMQVTPTAANVLQYCKIVQEQALLRNLGNAATEIADAVYKEGGTAEQVLELAERKIYALRRESTNGGLVTLPIVLKEVVEQIALAEKSGTQLLGLTTGLPDVDKVLQGMGAGDFILIASRPGMGKTSIALNIAVSAARASGKAVAIFSLEMSRHQLAMRLLSSESHIDSYRLNVGNIREDEWSRLTIAAGELSRLDIRIDDNPSMTVADMAAECRRLENLGLVVVDYLQLMQSAGTSHSWSNESRTQAVSDISRMMKVTAKELGVPLVCLSQLSRANEARQNKRPLLSDLRESGSIEQDADTVIGLYREGYYDPECEDALAAEAIVLKNRRGRVGTVFLRWIPEYTTYVCDERLHDDDEY